MIGTLVRNELRRLFVQPLAWALLAVVLVVLAYFFLVTLNSFLQLMPKLAALPDAPGVTDLVGLPLFRAIASVLLLIAPLLGMRCIAAERHNQSLPLLLASGVGEVRIVLGKYVAMLIFSALLITLAVLMALSLSIGTSLDLARFTTAALGLFLFAAALSALAVLASAYTRQPAVAAVMALALNLLLWMIDAGARYEGVTSSFINYLALPTHLEPFLHGVVASVDIVYFLLLSGVALTLAARRLAHSRTSG